MMPPALVSHSRECGLGLARWFPGCTWRSLEGSEHVPQGQPGVPSLQHLSGRCTNPDKTLLEKSRMGGGGIVC